MNAKPSSTPAALRRAGVALATLGWTILVVLAASRITLAAPRDDGALFAGLALGMACLISGATLLLLHALREGFGALDSFFAAALARASQRKPDAAQSPSAPAPRRGFIGDRPYVLRSNGAVEVETLFGPRLFSSLADAEDFIGA